MASLADERIGRLHKCFLDAAENFPDLRFAAVTPAEQPEVDQWPIFLEDGERHLGLTGKWWLLALNKPAGTPFMPIKAVWLKIADRLWEGGFFNGKRLDANEPQERLQAHFLHLMDAIAEFERLAALAAGYFTVPSPPTPGVDFPRENQPAHRWLEVVAGMPFVAAENQWGELVRQVPGDLFTASARAIEIVANPTATPAAKTSEGEGIGGAGAADQPPTAEPAADATNGDAGATTGETSETNKTTARKRRGRKKADYATQQREAAIASGWDQARDAKTYKGDFARDKGMKVADLDRLLERVAKRKKPSE